MTNKHSEYSEHGKYSKFSEYTEEQIIVRLLKINTKLDGFFHCVWGFLVGYATSRGDKVEDLLQQYAKEIREHFADVETHQFVQQMEAKYDEKCEVDDENSR
jgi:Na+-transporting NADH:ubiquinone oxidoreductase subunit NqrC